MLSIAKNDKFLNIFRTTKCVYMYVFLFALLFMRTIIPISTAIPSSVDSLFFSFLAIFGCGIIAVDFFTVRDMFRIRYWYLPLIFLLVIFLSAVVNRQYGLFGNIKTIIFSAIQFFVFMSIAAGLGKDKIKTPVRIVGDILSAFMLVCSVVSIIQFVLQIGYALPCEEGEQLIRQGFYESRLFGIYQDPNYSSVTGIISVFLCIYNFKTVKNIFFRIFYVVNIVVQFIYTVMSGSRTAEICLLATFFIGGYFIFRQTFSKKNIKRVAAIAISTILSFVCAAAIFVSVPICKYALTFVPTLVSTEIKEPVTFERVDVEGNEDISNLRFKIWESGIEVFKKHPILGTSPRAQLEIAKEEFPDGFIAQRNYELHNGYINVLVSTGVVGCAVVLCYMILIIVFISKKFFGKKKMTYDMTALLALLIIVSIAIASLFLTEIFFANSVCALLFWFFMGVLLCRCHGGILPPAQTDLTEIK